MMQIFQDANGKKIVIKGDYPNKIDDANDWGLWSKI